MRRLTKIAAASTVLVLALAGCANDDEGGNDAADEVCATVAATGPRSVWPTTSVVAATSRSTTPPRPAWRRPSTSSTRPAPRPRPRTARPSRRARTACARWPRTATTRSSVSASPTATRPTSWRRTSPRSASRCRRVRPDRPDEPNDNVAYLGFAEKRGLVPRRRRRRAQDPGRPRRLRRRREQRPDQEVRGRLRRRCRRPSTRTSRST